MNSFEDSHTVSMFPSKLTPAADTWVGLAILIIVLLSAVGNGLVLLTYQRSRKRMSASVVLHANLALADLSCCTLFYPVSIASYFQHAWQGGSASCAYYGFGYHVLSLCSTLTVTAISSLRYLKVCNYSFYAVWAKGANMQKTCCFIWLVAAVWSSFPLLGWGEYVLEPPGLSCIVGGGDNQTSVSDTVYVVCSFSLFTLIPFLVIVVPQCQIICTVARASCQVSGGRIRNRMNRIEKRLTWMFFCISLGFVMAWFPYTMVSFLFFFNKGHQYMAPWGFVILALLAKISHVYNPFIYFFINLGFRSEFCRLFCSFQAGQEETEADIYFREVERNPRPIDTQFQNRSRPQKKKSVSQDNSKGRNRGEDGVEEGSGSHRGISPVHTCWDVVPDDDPGAVSENQPAQVSTSV